MLIYLLQVSSYIFGSHTNSILLYCAWSSYIFGSHTNSLLLYCAWSNQIHYVLFQTIALRKNSVNLMWYNKEFLWEGFLYKTGSTVMWLVNIKMGQEGRLRRTPFFTVLDAVVVFLLREKVMNSRQAWIKICSNEKWRTALCGPPPFPRNFWTFYVWMF